MKTTNFDGINWRLALRTEGHGIQECCYQVLVEANRAITAPTIYEELLRKEVRMSYRIRWL